MSFDPQPTLEGPTLTMRPLRAGDLEALHAAASNPATWAGHPARDRYKRDVFEAFFARLIELGGTLVAIDRQSGRIIGSSRFYVPPDQPEALAIGFTFLDQAYWGGATNRAMKQMMLDHAFRSVAEVWFHIDPANIRSQKATAKLGAVHAYDATLDLSGTPTHWMCFRLRREDWQQMRGTDPVRASTSPAP
jgi:N-acetyltransferase